MSHDPISIFHQNLKLRGQISNVATNQSIKSLLLGCSPELPNQKLHLSVFGKDYEPGTYRVSERITSPGYITIDDDRDYNKWLSEEIAKDYECLCRIIMNNACWLAIDFMNEAKVIELVSQLFNSTFQDGRIFAESVYQQEYSDILRRCLSVLITGFPYIPFNEYDDANNFMMKLGRGLLPLLEDFDDREIALISAKSGLVGMNFKTSAAATSKILKKKTLDVDIKISPLEQINYVLKFLTEDLHIGFAIDSMSTFEHYSMIHPPREKSLMFFMDDVLESIIDLYLMERLIKKNSKLKIKVVPRALRFGNDISYGDLMHCLGVDERKKSRLNILPYGPLSGNLNGNKVGKKLVEEMESTDLLWFKGARNFESMQGLNKQTFYSFAVCRSISESVTGLDGEQGLPVFIHAEPGERCFKGYRNRHNNPTRFDSGRIGWLSDYTK